MQSKTIYAYDKTGKYIGEYATISEAAKSFGPQQYISNRIKQVLAGKMKTVKGYYVTYIPYFKLPPEVIDYINSPNAFHYKEPRPVYYEGGYIRYEPYSDRYMKYRKEQQVHQYTPKGDYMFTCNSIMEASQMNVTERTLHDVPNANKRIARAMNERTKTGKHYKWNGYYFSGTKYNNILKQN